MNTNMNPGSHHCLIHGTYFGTQCPMCPGVSVGSPPSQNPEVFALHRVAEALERIATHLELKESA